MWCFTARPDLGQEFKSEWIKTWPTIPTQNSPGSNTAICPVGNLHLVREIVVPKQEYEEPYLISFEYFDNGMSRACLDISFDQHFATSRDCVVVGAVQVVTCGELASLERTGLRLGVEGVYLLSSRHSLPSNLCRNDGFVRQLCNLHNFHFVFQLCFLWRRHSALKWARAKNKSTSISAAF